MCKILRIGLKGKKVAVVVFDYVFVLFHLFQVFCDCLETLVGMSVNQWLIHMGSSHYVTQIVSWFSFSTNIRWVRGKRTGNNRLYSFFSASVLSWCSKHSKTWNRGMPKQSWGQKSPDVRGFMLPSSFLDKKLDRSLRFPHRVRCKRYKRGVLLR